MIRIIISDEDTDHAQIIRNAISLGYGSEISDQIEIIRYWDPALTEAKNNQNIIALMRSRAGVQDCVNDSKSIYPRVLAFFPLGSNQFAQLNIFNQPEPPVIVVSGAGDDELRNNTAWGNGLEFWDHDLDTTHSDDASSDSNGFVLGKLLKIKDTLNCSWWEARYRARISADRTEPNRGTSPWDIHNGYGFINLVAAIAFIGLIPQDPYLLFTNEEQSFTAAVPEGYQGNSVTIVIAAGSVTSIISQDDANQKAMVIAKASAYDQLLAGIVYIVPPVIHYNVEQRYTADVPGGFIGQPVTIIVDPGKVASLVSQDNANDLALKAAKEEAQQLLNTTIAPILLGVIGNISIINNDGLLSGKIEAVQNADSYQIYKDGELLTSTLSLNFIDVITESGIVHKYKYRAVRGEQFTDFSSEFSIYYPLRKIIGFYSNINTKFGIGKALSLKEWEIFPGVTTTVLMNVYSNPIDLSNKKIGFLNLGYYLRADNGLLNLIYKFFKNNIAAFQNLNFIYEGEVIEEEGMGNTQRVNGNYTSAVTDGLIEVIDGNGIVVITLLEPSKMETNSITIMNLSQGAQVKIICENPDVLINGQSFLMIQNRYDGFNLKPDNNSYLILP